MRTRRARMKKKTLKTIIKWLLIYAIIGTIGVFSIGWLPILGPLLSYIAIQPYAKTHYPSEHVSWPKYVFKSGTYEQPMDDQVYGPVYLGVSLLTGEIVDGYYEQQLWQDSKPLIKEISAHFNAIYADEIDDNTFICIYVYCHWSRPRDRRYSFYMDVEASEGVLEQLSPEEAYEKMKAFARTIDPLISEIYRPNSYNIYYRRSPGDEEYSYHRRFTLD